MLKLLNFLVSLWMLAVMNCYSQSDVFQSSKKYIPLETGIKMAYIELGPDNLHTTLFLHGYTDSSRSFQHVIEELYRLNPESRIIVPDLRGHGSSGLPESNEGFTIVDFTKDVLDLIKQLNVDKVDIVGHSFGTAVAQTLALNHPEKVKSLVLMGTLVNGKKNVMVQDVLSKELIFGQWKSQLQKIYGSDWKSKLFELKPMDLGDEVVLFLKENWVAEARADADFLNSIFQETIDTPLVTWFETLSTLAEFDNSQSLSNLQIPTLIIWGADDDITPGTPDQQDLKMALQRVDFEIPIYFKTYKRTDANQLNIGHNFHWAFPKQIAADILMFTQNRLFDPTFESEMLPIKH